MQDTYQRLEEKIEYLGRGLQMSTGIMDKHKSDFQDVRSRISNLERQDTKRTADVDILAKDVSDVHKTIKTAISNEIQDIQWHSNRLESKVLQMVEDRLGGCHDVRTALEKRFQTSMERHTNELALRHKSTEDKLLNHFDRKFIERERHVQENDSEAVTAMCELVKSIDHDLREKVRGLESRVIEEQPELVAELIKASVPTPGDVKETLRRADQTTSRIAQDVLQKMTCFKEDINQRLEKHALQVEATIQEFISQTKAGQGEEHQQLHKDINTENGERKFQTFTKLLDQKVQERRRDEEIQKELQQLHSSLSGAKKEINKSLVRDIEDIYAELTNIEYNKMKKKKKRKKKPESTRKTKRCHNVSVKLKRKRKKRPAVKKRFRT